MRKNLIPQIAKLLGVELGEEFKVKDYCNSNSRTYKITTQGLKVKLVNHPEAKEFNALGMFNSLLVGDTEIVKLPWKPAYRQKYWTFGLKDGIWVVVPREWEDYPAEYLLFKAGWIYRTEKEACAALPGVAKEMDVEFMVKEDYYDQI
jgi:hypothetical protein